MYKCLGVGVDIAEIARFSQILSRPTAKRFLERTLHPREIEYISNIGAPSRQAQILATRWAAKEALVKATRNRGLFYHCIEIAKHQDGAPYFVLDPETVEKIGKGVDIHLSLSHEREYAIAYVSIFGKGEPEAS